MNSKYRMIKRVDPVDGITWYQVQQYMRKYWFFGEYCWKDFEGEDSNINNKIWVLQSLQRQERVNDRIESVVCDIEEELRSLRPTSPPKEP